MDEDTPIIAATGLDFEAEAASGFGIEVISGLNRRKYLRDLNARVRAGARGIISFGVAGGLSPELRAGRVVIASSVYTAAGCFKTCDAWSASLLAALPHAAHLPVFGAVAPVLTSSEKAAIFRKTGSATVDVESRDAAEIAAHYGLPYAVLRVVVDPAHREIPLSALSGVDDEGRTCAMAVLKALARRPGDILGVISIAIDGLKANRALQHTRRTLGPFFCLRTRSRPVPSRDETDVGQMQEASHTAQLPSAVSGFVPIRAWLARRGA
jgi:adenosylhomocysteine nucleosidase